MSIFRALLEKEDLIKVRFRRKDSSHWTDWKRVSPLLSIDGHQLTCLSFLQENGKSLNKVFLPSVHEGSYIESSCGTLICQFYDLYITQYLCDAFENGSFFEAIRNESWDIDSLSIGMKVLYRATLCGDIPSDFVSTVLEDLRNNKV